MPIPNVRKHRWSCTTRHLIAAPFLILAIPSGAADRFWDGGAANIGTNGDGLSTYTAGTWNTALANWDQGAGLAHVAWNNANLDNAIFGGTYSAGTKLVTLGASVTVNQISILIGDAASATSANRLDIGATADATNAITFGGTYSPAFPAINAGAANVRNTQFFPKITGTINGGLVVAHGSVSTNPASGRINIGNPANDFIGDVILVSGNLSNGSVLGNAANKLVLAGGSYFASGGGTSTLARDVVVSANSGLNLNATSALVLDLTGAVTGSANLTRYSPANLLGEVRFSGDLSGFSGTIENTGGGVIVIQSTVTSNGAWKVSSGVLRLNTAVDNTAIANGAGKSDLLMNGGTLDMNGKSETINGLSGTTGFVQNNLAATASTLTLGDGDATAAFSGTIRNNSGTGGILALTKIGLGTQTLSGNNTYTGLTAINAGTLVINGSLAGSMASTTGTLGGVGTIGGAVAIGDGLGVGDALLAPGSGIGTLNTGSVAFGSDSIFALEINITSGTSLTSDLLNSAGSLSIATGSALTVTDLGNNSALDLGFSFPILDYTGPWDGGTFTLGVGGPALLDGSSFVVGANAFSIDYNAPGDAVTLTVVPEPSSALCLLGGLGLLAKLRRRTTKTAANYER